MLTVNKGGGANMAHAAECKLISWMKGKAFHLMYKGRRGGGGVGTNFGIISKQTKIMVFIKKVRLKTKR